ncbi:BRO family protein [Klebsiella aerogenes]|uniref:BRO family protein n=1 Tax=Klebsiella aerogenes TaxID=548 RepID=UPI003A80D2BB
MNIVAKSEYNFHGVNLVPVANQQGVWFTSADLAVALKYKSAKSITNLFNQNSDEFSDGMTQVIESVTSGNYRKKVRVFSLRGAHLIAMFARTDVAKEFRRWVLDILDREVAHSPIAKQFTDDDLLSLCYLQFWMEKSQAVCKRLYPALKQAKSDYAGALKEIGHDIQYMTERSKEILLREAQHMDSTNFSVMRAMPILEELRGEGGWIH